MTSATYWRWAPGTPWRATDSHFQNPPRKKCTINQQLKSCRNLMQIKQKFAAILHYHIYLGFVSRSQNKRKVGAGASLFLTFDAGTVPNLAGSETLTYMYIYYNHMCTYIKIIICRYNILLAFRSSSIFKNTRLKYDISF